MPIPGASTYGPPTSEPLAWLARGLWLAMLCFFCCSLRAAQPQAAASLPLITNPSQLWGLPSEQKLLPHRVRLEGRVSYYDTMWKLFWLEGPDTAVYIGLSSTPPVMKAGQRVVIEGTIIPGEGLSAKLVTVTVLQEAVPPNVVDARGRINDLEALDCRIVNVDAYVDSQQFIDDDHLRLNLIIENRPVVGWVNPDDVRAIRSYQGCFIRTTGLYSRRYDPTGNRSSIELWLNAERDIEIFDTIGTTPLFSGPRTPLSELHLQSPGKMVLVRGFVQAQETGESVVLRDESGEIFVRSVQRQRLPVGSWVEAIGRVTRFQGGWVLDEGLYRRNDARTLENSLQQDRGVITTIAEIRDHPSGGEGSSGKVLISGSVAWSLPDADFFYLQDVTGGVRVHYSRAIMAPPPLLKYLQVEGVIVPGPGQPVVELLHYKDLGAMGPPKARLMSYERAISGREDGQWIALRGYLRQVVSKGDWRSIFVTTPYGEFVCNLLSPVNFTANPGSLVRIQGICESIIDEHGHISGLSLRSPFLHDLSIEEDAPVDMFDLPLRPLKSLGQLSLEKDMLRVRVRGTVVRASAGNQVQIQEDGVGVVLLCREDVSLSSGDLVDAVGILGAEGLHTVLREVVFRKKGQGTPPSPLLIEDLAHPSRNLDGVLVSARGRLVDFFDRGAFRCYTVQSGNLFFEAAMERAASSEGAPTPTLGAGFEFIGVCKLDYDDSRQIRGFQVQLRNEQDIVLVEPPRFLTLRRALMALAVLALITTLGALWVAILRRRVRVQTSQIREQLEHQARMEAGVQHAARLESLGVLAGGIAHDFNNLLMVIMGNLGVAMMNDEAMREVGEQLLEAQRGAGRAKELTQQLLTFAKGGSPLRTRVPMKDLVQNALGSCLHNQHIKTDLTFQQGLWDASIDKSQVSRALQNILINAVQAMPQGGTLRVELSNMEVRDDQISSLLAGAYVHLVISDSGPGIPADVLPRIFDPYFTTREEGIGLGLTAVYSIINKHDGHVDVESEPGKGTRVQLWLPAALADEVSADNSGQSGLLHETVKLGKVLLMDDEEAIRRVVSLILSRMGLEVVIACDGGEALDLFIKAKEAGSPFTLLIFDLSVPGGMGGKDAMSAIRRLDKEVPSIVSSGYSSDPVMADPARYGFTEMVAKPYEIEELGRAIAKALSNIGR